MHVIKCGASDYGSVRGEACREKGFNSKVGTINSELTQNNYSLIDREPPKDIDGYIKSLGVKRKIRADAVRCASIIVDYPKDETKPPKEFFEDAKKGLQEHFGVKDNAILYARVHVDEGHDHMHFAFVPLVEHEKTYKDGHTEKQVKLSAKEILTQASLRELHPFMQRYMSERGYKGTLHYADGEKRDKDFLEHKIEKIEKEIQSLTDRHAELDENIALAEGLNTYYNDENDRLQGSIDELESQSTRLKEKIEGQKVAIESNSEELVQQEEHLRNGKKAIARVDAVTHLLNDKGNKFIKAEEYTIPAQKTLLGAIKEPERVGVFIENMDKGQVESLMQRVRADERIESTLTRTQEQCRSLIAKAQAEAKEIRAEATADRNETIAKAEQIKRDEQNIIKKAREWAVKVRNQYQELADAIKVLLGKKKLLDNEIARLETYKGKIEPLRQEVQELSRAKKILSGELDNELTQARFETTSEMSKGRGYGNNIDFRLRDEGKLIALYADGKQRIVGRNEHGGFDNKTLADTAKGLCRIGAFVEEERVRVPKSLLEELIQSHDKTKPISQNLENLIQQQRDVAKAKTVSDKDERS